MRWLQRRGHQFSKYCCLVVFTNLVKNERETLHVCLCETLSTTNIQNSFVQTQKLITESY